MLKTLEMIKVFENWRVGEMVMNGIKTSFEIIIGKIGLAF